MHQVHFFAWTDGAGRCLRHGLRTWLALFLLSNWPFPTAFAGGLPLVVNGMAIDQVLETCGQPTGRMEMGGRVVLLYPDGQVEIRDGAVTAVVMRRAQTARVISESSTAREGLPEVRTDASDGNAADLSHIMRHLRTGSGLDCANAAFACKGPWAAPAVPLLVRLLDNTEQFEIVAHTIGRDGHIVPIPAPPGTRMRTNMRTVAGNALIRIGPGSWDACMQVLQSGNPRARAKAAFVLDALADKDENRRQAFSTILVETFESPAMADSSAMQARTEMMRIVANQPGPAALAALHRRLATPRTVPAEALIDALCMRKDSESIPLVVRIMLTDRDEAVRRHAASSLRAWGGADIAAAAREGVSHSDPEIRLHVLHLFAQTRQAVFADDFMHFLRDRDSVVRRDAARHASVFDTPEMRLAVADMLSIEAEDAIASEAGRSLVDMAVDVHDPRFVAALRTGARHRNVNKREWFVHALGLTGAPGTFEDIATAALHDQSENVRVVALSTLGRFADGRTADMLLQSLAQDPSPRARRTALRQGMEDRALMNRKADVLRNIVRTADGECSRDAAFALGEFNCINRDPHVIETLIRALGHPDESIRFRAESYLRREAGMSQHGVGLLVIETDPATWRERFRQP